MPPAPTVPASTVARLLPDWRASGASYRSLADRIGLLLEDGRLVTGRRLPAERVLAAELGVSRTTVSAAYALLRERGRLVTLHGSGSVLALGVPRAEEAAGRPDVMDLSNAVPPAWPELPEYVERAAARLPPLLTAIGLDYIGLAELRERIADRYVQRGLPTTPAQIMVTTGAQHAIGLVLRSRLRRADRLLLDVPSYPHAIDAFREAGARLVPIGMPGARPDVGEWERLLRELRPELAYLMPDFHNPTGSSLTAGERRRLLTAAAASGTLLLVDETTAELAIDDVERQPPLAALAVGSGAEVITVGSIGKTVWHGLRIGWIRADSRTIAEIAAARPSRDLGTPVLEQLVVSELLPDIDRVLADRAGLLRTTRDAVVARIAAELPDWQVPVPPGGLCIWVALPDARSSMLVPAAAAVGLRITAGPRFGLDGAFERQLRIPITRPVEESVDAIGRLAEAWRASASAVRREEAYAPVL
jgi:DNA-binding transcriptional MocR family regulator